MARQLRQKVDPLRVSKLVAQVCVIPNKPEASEKYNAVAKKLPEFLSSAKAPKTEQNYFLAWKRFEKFCDENNLVALPSQVEDVLVYFMSLAEDATTAAPVLQARSAIRHFNVIKEPSESPVTDNPLIGLVVESIERKFAHPVNKKKPTSVELVKKIVTHLTRGI